MLVGDRRRVGVRGVELLERDPKIADDLQSIEVSS